MRPRNTIIALILLAVVGGYAYFNASQKPGEQTNKLFKLKADDITAITLKYPDREIGLAKESGKWSLVKPIKADADLNAVRTLAETIAGCEVKKTVDEKPASLDPFGLARPEVVVAVVAEGQPTLPGIEVGKTTPVGFSAYIKTTDKPAVMLTTSAFPPGVKKTVEDLRDHELVKFKADDARKIILERDDGGAVELDKDRERWTIVKPAKYEADQAVVEKLLSGLTGARIEEFADDKPDNLARFGLDKPRLTVSIFTGKEGARQSILLGAGQTEAEKDAVYVKRGESAPVYTVHTWLFTDTNKTLLDLRDKTVIAFEPSQVGLLKVSADQKSFELERLAGGKWQVVEGGTKTAADLPKVQQFLNKLQNLKAQSIAEDPMSDAKKFGLDAPAGELTLNSNDGKLLVAVKLARVERRNEGGSGETPAPPARVDYYAISSASGAVYALDNLTFQEMSRSSGAEFKSKSESPTPAATATARPPAGPAPAAKK